MSVQEPVSPAPIPELSLGSVECHVELCVLLLKLICLGKELIPATEQKIFKEGQNPKDHGPATGNTVRRVSLRCQEGAEREGGDGWCTEYWEPRGEPPKVGM